jgi:Glycosyltransferase family 87
MQNRRRWLIFAIITFLLYAALSALYPLSAGLLRPRHTWAMQTGANVFVAIAHIGLYIALLLTYSAALSFAIRHSSFVIRWVWLGWMAFAFALLFSFPGESADIFDYIFRGRMLAEHGLSPLITTPSEVQQYAFHRYVSWSQWVDAYGPIWEYASAGVSLLARAQFTPNELAALATGNDVCTRQPLLCNALADYVTAYRLLALALSALCGALIYAIVKRERDATIARVALLGWLWNPLVLISTAVGAHNDVLMLVFVLLGLWLFQRQRFLLGLMALVLAAHVKITALVLLPVFGVWLIGRVGWMKTIALIGGAFLFMLPISWLLYVPLGGWATLPKNLFERSQLSTNSLGELVFLFLRDGLGWARFEAQQPVARLFPLAFVVVAGLYLLRGLWRHTKAARVSETDDLFRLSALVVMLYLLIGSYWFQPWYLAWPIALAWLRPEGRLVTRVLPVFATGTLVVVTLSDYLRNAAVPVLLPWQISVLMVGGMGLSLALSVAKAGSHKP